jgi:hypothetical protein
MKDTIAHRAYIDAVEITKAAVSSTHGVDGKALAGFIQVVYDKLKDILSDEGDS